MPRCSSRAEFYRFKRHPAILSFVKNTGETWQIIRDGLKTFATFGRYTSLTRAVGAAGTIIHSTDGGETWEQEHTGVNNDLYTITRVKDGETLWVVGQGGVVLRRPKH